MIDMWFLALDRKPTLESWTQAATTRTHLGMELLELNTETSAQELFLSSRNGLIALLSSLSLLFLLFP